MNKTKVELFKDASLNGFSINNQKATIKAIKSVDKELTNDSVIYLVEVKLISVRGKVASITFKEFPYTTEGNLKADQFIARMVQN